MVPPRTPRPSSATSTPTASIHGSSEPFWRRYCGRENHSTPSEMAVKAMPRKRKRNCPSLTMAVLARVLDANQAGEVVPLVEDVDAAEPVALQELEVLVD